MEKMIDRSSCPICGIETKDIMQHVLETEDKEHLAVIEKIDKIIKSFVNCIPYVGELTEAVRHASPNFWFVTYEYVVQTSRQLVGVDRVRNFLDDFSVTSPDDEAFDTVKRQCANVAKFWQPGCYYNVTKDIMDRENWNITRFSSYFQSTKICAECGSENAVSVIFVDNDSQNFLLSNLEPLCANCQSRNVSKDSPRPFSTISKDFTFAAAHRLPDYDGACNNLHGHEWKLTVSVRRKSSPVTGMVIDFKDLKKIVNKTVIDLLDHGYLNDFLPNPTAENIVVWIWERLMFDGLLKGIESIQLWESPTSFITLTVDDMLSVFS